MNFPDDIWTMIRETINTKFMIYFKSIFYDLKIPRLRLTHYPNSLWCDISFKIEPQLPLIIDTNYNYAFLDYLIPEYLYQSMCNAYSKININPMESDSWNPDISCDLSRCKLFEKRENFWRIPELKQVMVNHKLYRVCCTPDVNYYWHISNYPYHSLHYKYINLRTFVNDFETLGKLWKESILVKFSIEKTLQKK
jgi:hypothetical protein